MRPRPWTSCFVVAALAYLPSTGELPGAAPSTATQAAPARAPKRLGILIFPGVEVIDFAGPYAVFTSASKDGGPLFEVVTVGLGPELIRANPGTNGLKLTPDHTLADCPPLDVLVLPGGEIGAMGDSPAAMEFIEKNVREAECVMSVCNAAFVLAQGGHLKGLSATTFYWFLDELAQDEPTCTVVHDQRFVDNGKIVTTAGLTSGIDGALHVVERYSSRYDAEQLALGLEYDWRPDSGWARANLGDRHLIRMLGNGFDFPPGSVSAWRTVRNDGTTAEWTKRWSFASPLGRDELLAVFEARMAAVWKEAPDAGKPASFAFQDEKGRDWSAVLELVPAAEGTWSATIHLAQRPVPR